MVASVKVDFDLGPLRSLSEQARKQMPFAAARALTQTAKAAEKSLQQTMGREFDAPAPYIARGTFVRPGTKRDLSAEVGMRDQARGGRVSPALYVREQFIGGRRGMKPYERAMAGLGALPEGWKATPAAGIKRDRHGNPNRRELTEVLGALRAGMRVFSGRGKRAAAIGYFVVTPSPIGRTAHLQPGIWRRIQRGKDSTVVPVFLFVRDVSYQPRIDLPRVVGDVVRREFNTLFDQSMREALRSAR